MAEESFQEKTEKATPRKREEIRRKGEVAKTRELPSAAVLLSGVLVLAATGSWTYREVSETMRQMLSLSTITGVGTSDFLGLLEQSVWAFLLAVAPLFTAIVVTALLSNVVQVGFLLSLEVITPKISKIDPLKGFQRLVSKQSFMELVKALLKLLIIGSVAALSLHKELAGVADLGDLEAAALGGHVLACIFTILLKCALAMLILVAIDYAFQRWEFEKRNRMTKQEVKEELKKTEGDPLIKARVRSVQRELARSRMIQAVAKADVVITNPTHVAVALSYESPTMRAPRVVAKGAEKMAERIREAARHHGIPVVENRKLARMLYAMVDLGREIPGDLYQAVAEILAYVYRLKSAPGGVHHP